MPVRVHHRARSGRSRTFAVALVLAALALLLYHAVSSQAATQPIGDRSQFATDACIAFNPTSGNNNRTVFIDPGHGGTDPGAESNGPNGTVIQEKTLTLAVGLDVLDRLRAEGYRVVMSRTNDTEVATPQSGDLSGGLYTAQGEHRDIAARAACADDANAQLLLSIHFDSYSDPTVGGVETLYDPSRPFSANNVRFANDVQRSTLAALARQGWQVPDRGVLADTNAGTPALTSQGAAYGHLLELGPASPGWFTRPSTMPGALSEPLFITDPGEAAVAVNGTGQETLATGFVNAINAYFAGK